MSTIICDQIATSRSCLRFKLPPLPAYRLLIRQLAPSQRLDQLSFAVAVHLGIAAAATLQTKTKITRRPQTRRLRMKTINGSASISNLAFHEAPSTSSNRMTIRWHLRGSHVKLLLQNPRQAHHKNRRIAKGMKMWAMIGRLSLCASIKMGLKMSPKVWLTHMLNSSKAIAHFSECV